MGFKLLDEILGFKFTGTMRPCVHFKNLFWKSCQSSPNEAANELKEYGQLDTTP